MGVQSGGVGTRLGLHYYVLKGAVTISGGVEALNFAVLSRLPHFKFFAHRRQNKLHL